MKANMNEEIIGWLLEGPSWMRFAVESQLLDSEPDPQTALQDKAIQKLVR